jgi:hypothetical protein
VAANIFDVPASAVACVAATAKTVLGVFAATNVRLKVTEYVASFDGATSTNAPAIVEANRCTFGANPPGTNSTSVTPVKRDSGAAETIQATAGKAWTTEPTTHTQQRVYDVGQYNGTLVVMLPFSAPHIVVGASGFAIRVTSPNNVNFGGHITAEE